MVEELFKAAECLWGTRSTSSRRRCRRIHTIARTATPGSRREAFTAAARTVHRHGVLTRYGRSSYRQLSPKWALLLDDGRPAR